MWLCLPFDMAALAVSRPIAARLAVRGPVIDRPGCPPTRLLLVRSPAPLSDETMAILERHGIGHAGSRSLIELPPARCDLSALTWVQEPIPGVELPSLAEVTSVLSRIGQTGDHGV